MCGTPTVRKLGAKCQSYQRGRRLLRVVGFLRRPLGCWEMGFVVEVLRYGAGKEKEERERERGRSMTFD